MKKKNLDDFYNSPATKKNYPVLVSSGALQFIETLNQELNDLDELLDEASELFNKQSIKGLTVYITEKILHKFIPSYMAFVFHENLASDKPEIICFQNMKPIEPLITIDSIEPYKHFFSLSPTSVDFKVFEYMVGRPDLTDIFLPLNPQKIIPVMGFDGVHGFIVVGKKVLNGDFTEQETAYLDRLIQFASISFRNNIHYKRAITDFKTKLYNHSFFIIRLEEELARIKRYRAEVSLIMIDVDFFKKFNDTYGHLAGDAVLAHLAQLLNSFIRTEDVAARFGGEEFVIMLVQCNQDHGFMVAERIRKAVEESEVHFEGHTLKITISLGVTFASHNAPVPDSSTLINRADSALYQSKSKGRNCTSIFSQEFAALSKQEKS